MAKKQSLVEKYEIPIENLDFTYVQNCGNIVEIERILEILRSGEEGFYPDLTKCTELRLRELDANNRMLRIEVQCQRTSRTLDAELMPILEQIRMKDQYLRSTPIEHDELNGNNVLPPIRLQKDLSSEEDLHSTKINRIQSSDYDKWDKYDADTECLKIDLKEEQNHAQSLIEEKRKKSAKIMEIMPKNTLTDEEKYEFGEKHRIKGNEYFKCEDYAQALHEYTNSINHHRTAVSFNNRALTYLKLKLYTEAIEDCDECLTLDSTNIKAMLRKCEALLNMNRKNEAYKVYAHVLENEPDNIIAKKAIAETSIRVSIEDVNADRQCDELKSSDAEVVEECDDFAHLIIPKRIVPSKATQAMKHLNRICTGKE